MSKIILNNVADLTSTTTAQATINANSATIQTAFDNTLSRDGTVPNPMLSNLDMNGYQVLNLPAPATTGSALRLQDLNSFIGGGTISTLPIGGTTGQVLAKNSNTNYDVKWLDETSDLVAGSNITITGTTPATIAVSTSPTLVTPNVGVATATSINKVTITAPATSATLTIPNGVTLSGPAISGVTMTLGNAETVSGAKTFNSGTVLMAGTISGTTALNATATASGTLTLPATTDTLVGKATTDTLTNKTLVAPVLGAATATTIAFSPTTGGVVGTTTNDNANAGNVGEYISSTLVAGSAVALTTGVTSNITSISLTAGDWDVSAVGAIVLGATTTTTNIVFSLSTTTGTLNLNVGNYTTVDYATGTVLNNASPPIIGMPPTRFSLASTTTVFLVANATFGTSTMSGFGIIRARRIR